MKIFAHRGGAALAPENTIAAFDVGLKHGADGLELDVRLSRDGIVVVHHDAMLDRTTDQKGPLARRTADELAKVDAGCRFEVFGHHPFRNRGIGIPTLAAVLDQFPVPTIIELKVDSVALARATMETVRKAGAVDRVCLASFSKRVLKAVRRFAPEIATSAAEKEVRWAVCRSWIRWPHRRVPYRAFQVPEKSGAIRVVSPAFVAAARRADLPVQVWTVDDPDQARRLLDWGVDALITDRPDVIVLAARDWVRRQLQSADADASGAPSRV